MLTVSSSGGEAGSLQDIVLLASSSDKNSNVSILVISAGVIEQQTSLASNTHAVVDAVWSESGDRIAVAIDQASIDIYDYKSGLVKDNIKLPANTNVESKAPLLVRFSKRHFSLIYIGYHQTIYVYDRSSKKIAQELSTFKRGSITSMKFNNDGSKLVFGSSNGEILLYNSKTNQFHPYISSMTQKWFAASGDCGIIAIWDLSGSKEPIYEKSRIHDGPVTGLEFSTTLKDWYCTTGLDKMIKVHQIRDKLVHSVMAEADIGAPASRLALGPNHTMIVGSTHGDILLYKTEWTSARIIKRIGGPVACLSIQPISSASKIRMSKSQPSLSLAALESSSLNVAPVHREARNLQDGALMDFFSPVQSSKFRPSMLGKSLVGGSSVAQNSLRAKKLNLGSLKSSVARNVGSLENTDALNAAIEPISSARQALEMFSPKKDDSHGGLNLPSKKSALAIEVLAEGFLEGALEGDEGTHIDSEIAALDDSANNTPERQVTSDNPNGISGSSDGAFQYPADRLESTSIRPVPITHSLDKETFLPSKMNDPTMRLAKIDLASELEKVLEKGPGYKTTAPSTNFQYKIIENAIENSMSKFREQFREDFLDLHCEMMRQFYNQKEDLEESFIRYRVEPLIEEIRILREENERLKMNF